MIRHLLLAAWLCSVAGVLRADVSAVDDGGMIRLENGGEMRLTIAPAHGGELSSLQIRLDGGWRELIYKAGDYAESDGWRGKAPFLWPAVGPTFDPGGAGRGYRVNGRHHGMPAHGFARDRAWRVLRHGAAADHAYAALGLASDADTRALYPWDFALEVEYRLERERLVIEYTVAADAGNDSPMPFCIGNHVTFRAPLIEGSNSGELRFSTGLPDLLLREPDRTFAGRVEPSPWRGEHAIAELPRRNAVSLGGPPGPAELTLIDPSGLRLTLRHEASAEPAPPVIRFNLWADTEEGFFSPEPWLGTQNGLNTGAGVIRLEPGAQWRWRIDIIPSGDPTPVRNHDEVAP